ncbi:MAG: hypothetical protein ACE5HF_08285 [Gemmatimonadota bacterium]
MEISTDSGTPHSGHYLATITVATVVVAILAWIGQNPALAYAAAILGLYSLHLLSIRFILEAHRQQLAALGDQAELLERIAGPAAESGAVENGQLASSGAAAEEAAADRVAAAWSFETADGPPEVGKAAGRAPALDGLPPAPQADEMPLPAPSVLQAARVDVPIPRHFALGTVALVRNVLSPARVAEILVEQRKRPDLRFGDLAVELGFISESQKEDLLLKQQEGLFTDAELRDARMRLKEYRESHRAEPVEVD